MIRIISDLHYRDSSSHLSDLHQLEPALQGVDELWVNGDLCDAGCDYAPENMESIMSFFTDRVATVRFITGNHDPQISDVHALSAAADRVWVTHGDVFLADIVPWSTVRPLIRKRLEGLRASHPELDHENWHDRLTLHRLATQRLPEKCLTGRVPLQIKLRHLFQQLFPPRKPWHMLKTWLTWPHITSLAMKRWQPQAQVLITGHIHFPHIWKRENLTIVNTGAFSGPLGALTVDIDENTGLVQIRRLRLANRRFEPAEPHHEIQLAAAPAPQLSPSS